MNLVMECEFGNRTQAYRDGKTFLVDMDDYEQFVYNIKFTLDAKNYVKVSWDKSGRFITSSRLSRIIMECPEDLVVDHINGDTLDNRRCNLRIVTVQQNSMNRKVAKTNKSGVSGVTWYGRDNKWVSHLSINKKKLFLGYFNNLEDAIKARKDAEEEYFGEFARR